MAQTADEPRFVVDCRVKPVALVGHVKMTLAREGIIVRSTGEALTPKTVSKHTWSWMELVTLMSGN